MTCECLKWYTRIDASFDKARGLNDIGHILEFEAIGSLFQQAILVIKSPVPFTRPSFYLMTGGGQPALHRGGDGQFCGLEQVASRSAASVDVMIWSQALGVDDSVHLARSENEPGAQGITYAAMGADSTLYSISYTRNGPAVTEDEKIAVAWQLRYLNELVRRHCVALNLFERGASTLTEREIEILRCSVDAFRRGVGFPWWKSAF
jgi:hypothetical protein